MECTTLRRHPTGLWVLSMTETWERFSYYGVRSLLVLYLTSGALDAEQFERVYGSQVTYLIFGKPFENDPSDIQRLAFQINEWYSGLAFVTPLLGGVVADQLLGVRNTCVIGGLMMVAAHACMAVDRLFLIGLVLLMLGNGAFKPTISAQLSGLYEAHDVALLRESGFALYYLAINLGALLAPLVCGMLQQHVSFHAGFGSAGIGMLGGLAIYLAGGRHLPPEKHAAAIGVASSGNGTHPRHRHLQHRVGDALDEASVFGRAPGSQQPLLCAGHGRGHPAFGGGDEELSERSSPKGKSLEGGSEKWQTGGGWPARRALALAAICSLLVPYWACWEQMANSVPLYYEHHVERELFGHVVPAAALQSLSPLFTLVLLPFLSARWAQEARSGTERSAAFKLALGAACQALGWLCFALSATGVAADGEDGDVAAAMPEGGGVGGGGGVGVGVGGGGGGGTKASLLWPLLANLLYTVGHLHVGPVGLSLATRCAPPSSQSSAVGIWFLFGGLGGPVAGWLGGFYALWPPRAFFGVLAAIACANAAVLGVCAPRLERTARGQWVRRPSR